VLAIGRIDSLHCNTSPTIFLPSCTAALVPPIRQRVHRDSAHGALHRDRHRGRHIELAMEKKFVVGMMRIVKETIPIALKRPRQ
jgi:hypothetical protein